jgi:hypothetical protein
MRRGSGPAQALRPEPVIARCVAVWLPPLLSERAPDG